MGHIPNGLSLFCCNKRLFAEREYMMGDLSKHPVINIMALTLIQCNHDESVCRLDTYEFEC